MLLLRGVTPLCFLPHTHVESEWGAHIIDIQTDSEATITIRRSVGHLLGYRFDLSGPSAETRTGTRAAIASGRPQQRRCALAFRRKSWASAGEIGTEKKSSVWPGRSGGRRSSSRSFSGSAMVGTRGGGAAAAASGGDRGSSASRAHSSSSRQPSADEKGGDLDEDGQVSHDDVVELLNCNFRNDAHFVCESARVDV